MYLEHNKFDSLVEIVLSILKGPRNNWHEFKNYSATTICQGKLIEETKEWSLECAGDTEELVQLLTKIPIHLT